MIETSLLKAKIRAFSFHLFLAILILLGLALLVAMRWYPQGLFALQGVGTVLLVLVLVDVVLGPLLTFLVYVPGKKTLILDMSLVVCLQLVALGYGVRIIHSERPVALAFMYDRFFVVQTPDLVGELAASERGLAQWRNGPVLAHVMLPLRIEMGLMGVMDKIPQKPSEVVQAATYAAFPQNLNLLRSRATFPHQVTPQLKAMVANVGRSADLSEDRLILFPVVGRVGQGVAVVNADNGELLDIISLPD